MKRHRFTTDINVPREKIWQILWDKKTYSAWTSPFSEGSKMETDLQEGSRVFFLNAAGDAGMISIIEKKDEPNFISFRHIGIIKDGKEITEGKEIEKWTPSYENYTLKEKNGITQLMVDIDIDEKYKDFFYEAWPKALANVKSLSEQKEK